MTASKHCHPGMCPGCKVLSPGEVSSSVFWSGHGDFTLKAGHFPGWPYSLAWTHPRVTMLSCCHSQSPGEMSIFLIARHRVFLFLRSLLFFGDTQETYILWALILLSGPGQTLVPGALSLTSKVQPGSFHSLTPNILAVIAIKVEEFIYQLSLSISKWNR